ncbi:MAG: M3 family metallopeptidase [Candidatus Peribacteria bacterium]|nr:M3 family metallopeptidase [Candidatus Peribacteria bacterium]
MDVYPGKGKRGGAFCSDTSKSLPVYLMLNYTGKIRDVSVLIHELGHGINAILQRKQNALNYGATISTAEVASTFFENLLIRKLSSDLTGEELLSFRMSTLDDMVSTIQRQVACFRFEQNLHKTFRRKGYLPAEKI